MENSEKTTVEGLKIKFRSKRDLYNRMTVDLQYHLPSFRMCPIQFIKDILSGRKQVLKRQQIIELHIPAYAELSVKKMYPKLLENLFFKDHMLDYPNSVLPERSFFYPVVTTLFQKETLQLVRKSRENRKIKDNMEEDKYVKLTPEFKEEIEGLFNLSTTPGRAVHLLKKKSRLLTKRTLPKEYETNLIPMMQKKFHVKRLQRKQEEPQRSAFMSRDQIMQDENDRHDREEEEKKEN